MKQIKKALQNLMDDLPLAMLVMIGFTVIVGAAYLGLHLEYSLIE